jgi:hypothetical protein
MKNSKVLKIFLLSRSSLAIQWSSLMGDKYSHALPFPWEFTTHLHDADVISWDGFMNSKSSYYYQEVIEVLKDKKSLLILENEATSLYQKNSFLSRICLDDIPFIELSGGNVVPEDLLAALEECHKRLGHV